MITWTLNNEKVNSSRNRITRIPTHRREKGTEDQMRYRSQAKASRILYQKEKYYIEENLTILQVLHRVSGDPHTVSDYLHILL